MADASPPGRHRKVGKGGPVMKTQQKASRFVPAVEFLSILVVLLAVASAPAWADQAALPEGVPNIFDAEVRAHFEPVAVINLRGNPDFPMLILIHKAVEDPGALTLPDVFKSLAAAPVRTYM